MFIALMAIFFFQAQEERHLNAHMSLLLSSRGWMIECYKYSAPLALSSENLDYNDLLFAQSSTI
jgi:hypothetical protein